MTKEEFKSIRQALKCRGDMIAKKLGITIAEAHAYESGKKEIPNEIAEYLRAINPKSL